MPLTGLPRQLFAIGGRTVVVGRDFMGTINLGDRAAEPRWGQLDRSTMLAKVQKHWITEPLAQLLGGAPAIALTLEEHPDAVPGLPIDGLYGSPAAQLPRVLPADTAIEDVFDARSEGLLILGAPGSGKSILLRQLAGALVVRAQGDEHFPIPVIFNLGTWGATRRPLRQWLVDRLVEPSRYDVPRPKAETLVEEELIVPLLDGLDEVPQPERAACVSAINEFRRGRTRDAGLVVTSRLAEYEDLRPLQLELQHALLIKPLDLNGIRTYLASRGPELDGLRAHIERDQGLRELASTPLMLSIMAPVYAGAPDTALEPGGDGQRRRRLFSHYVATMFTRQGRHSPYSQPQTVAWLEWLARSLGSRGRQTLYLEQLQADWLPTAWAQRVYDVLDRVGSAGWMAVLFSLPAMLSLLLMPAANSLALAWVVAIVGALVGGLLGGHPSALPGWRPGWWSMARGALLASLTVGIGAGLLGALVGVSARAVSGTWGGAGLGILAFVLGALAGGIAGSLVGGPGLGPRAIIPVEKNPWSARRAAPVALLGLGVGAAVGVPITQLGLALGWVQATSNLEAALESVVLFGIPLALVCGIPGGYGVGQISPSVVPNHGIHRSARTAINVGARVALVATLTSGLMFSLIGGGRSASGTSLFLGLEQADLQLGLLAGLLIGPTLGMIAGLSFGGYACFSHVALRTVLWRWGVAPVNYVGFLNYAMQCSFMYREGGGYRFLHPLLRDYFATIPRPELAPAASGQLPAAVPPAA